VIEKLKVEAINSSCRSWTLFGKQVSREVNGDVHVHVHAAMCVCARRGRAIPHLASNVAADLCSIAIFLVHQLRLQQGAAGVGGSERVQQTGQVSGCGRGGLMETCAKKCKKMYVNVVVLGRLGVCCCMYWPNVT
jgi:hypothetical protein